MENEQNVLLNDESKKQELDSKFEMGNMEEEFSELNKDEKLWYLIRSTESAWIIGSTK